MPATCAKNRYRRRGMITAHTMAMTGWRVLNRKAVATKTIIAVQTIPNRGKANMVRIMMSASPSRRIHPAKLLSVEVSFSAGVDSSIRHPTSSNPTAVNPVSAVRTYGQKVGARTMLRTLEGDDTQFGMPTNPKKRAMRSVPAPSFSCRFLMCAVLYFQLYMSVKHVSETWQPNMRDD